MGPFETERLRLRRFREEDFDEIYRLIYTDSGVYRMYSSIGGHRDTVRTRVLHHANEPVNNQFGRLAVEFKATGALIGQVHLDPYVNTDFRLSDDSGPFNWIDVELAFAFGRAYWGQGYAYEACRRLVDYAFLELRLPRLVGGAMDGNQRSIKLHKRLGYRFVRDPDPSAPVEWVTVLENKLLQE